MHIGILKVFTFGREHEINHAVRHFKSDESKALIESVINCVHDILENVQTFETAKSRLITAFSNGKSGVWESTGSWILKLSKEFPEFSNLWQELSQHKSAAVRYRVACFLDCMPEELIISIGANLVADNSKKVKAMAEARIEEAKA